MQPFGLDWYGDGSLYVVNIALACCALEVDTAAARMTSDEVRPSNRPDAGGLGWTEEASSERLRSPRSSSTTSRSDVVVVVSGTVTDRLAPGVLAVIDACSGPDRRPTVVSFGACASAGGPYWDSYAVTKGIDQLVAVDVYVPGCPPPPEALSAVLDQLAGRVPA